MSLRFVREDVRGTKYTPVEPLESIARDVGIPVQQLVKVRTFCMQNCVWRTLAPHASNDAGATDRPAKRTRICYLSDRTTI